MPTDKKQLPEDFKEFIRLLNSEKVEYFVLGGWAVNLYSSPRATADIDFLIGIDDANVTRVLSALSQFGLPGVEREHFTVLGNVIRMGVPPTRIELLTGATGIDFQDCYKRTQVVEIDGINVNFIAKDASSRYLLPSANQPQITQQDKPYTKLLRISKQSYTLPGRQ